MVVYIRLPQHKNSRMHTGIIHTAISYICRYSYDLHPQDVVVCINIRLPYTSGKELCFESWKRFRSLDCIYIIAYLL